MDVKLNNNIKKERIKAIILFILGLAGFITVVYNFKRYCDLTEKEDL
jgi:hypothetical protein